MSLWQYIISPTNRSLGPAAMLAILLGAIAALGGLLLIVLPKEMQRFSARWAPQAQQLKIDAQPGQRHAYEISLVEAT